MAKAKTEQAIKAAQYRSRSAKIDDSTAARRFKQPDEVYQPLFKKLNDQFPTKNYKMED